VFDPEDDWGMVDGPSVWKREIPKDWKVLATEEYKKGALN
jgi:hypothetical protein